MLKGSLEFWLDELEFHVLQEGDSFWFESNLGHRWFNPTDEEAAHRRPFSLASILRSEVIEPNRYHYQYEANAKQPGQARFPHRGLALQLDPEFRPILLI
jgi:hypothetical protein